MDDRNLNGKFTVSETEMDSLTIGYVVAFVAIGMATGVVYKKILPYGKSTSMVFYIILGVISSVAFGLIGQAILVWGNIVSQSKGPQYADNNQAGNPAIGYDYSELWLSLLIAAMGAFIALSVYKILMRYRRPDDL